MTVFLTSGLGLRIATRQPPKICRRPETRLDVALAVGGVLVGVVVVVASHLEVREVHLIAKDTADASEAPDELRALLGAVGDELEAAAKVLVLVRQPLHHGDLLRQLQVHAGLGVLHVLIIRLLLLGEEVDVLLLRLAVEQDAPLDRQILPHDERLDSPHLQTRQGVIHPEAVLAAVLADLVEVLADELLLLDELDVAERLGGELDGLVEPVLAAVGDVHNHENVRLQALVK